MMTDQNISGWLNPEAIAGKFTTVSTELTVEGFSSQSVNGGEEIQSPSKMHSRMAPLHDLAVEARLGGNLYG